MIRPVHIFVFASALVLTACGAGRAVGEATTGVFEAREGACPIVGILAEANRVTNFRGRGRDLPDVHYYAQITDVRSQCDYGRTGGQRYAFARVRMNFEVELGSAAHPGAIDIPYFVAVVARESQEILVKEVYSIHAPLDGGRRAVVLEDNIDRIAIPVVEASDGALYEILVGFELTPEQLDFNRRREEY